jgi:hypothetical protein
MSETSGMSRLDALALRCLERSLGESPGLSPSKAAILITLERAAGLLPSGLSLRASLWDSRPEDAPTAHVHCERYLAALAGASSLPRWERYSTPAQLRTLVLRGARLLRGHRGGWRLCPPPDAAEVLRIRRALAARDARLNPPVQFALALEEQ